MSYDRFLNGLRLHAARMDAMVAHPRIATVVSVQAGGHRARVRIEPDGVETGFIPIGAAMVGNGMGIVSPPSPGDQVLVVAQEGDASQYVVVSRIFSARQGPPVSPATEKPIQPGEVAIFTPGAWLHISGGVIHAEATTLKFKGKVEVDGDVEVTGDVKAGGVSLKEHVHPGVRRANEKTDRPEQ